MRPTGLLPTAASAVLCLALIAPAAAPGDIYRGAVGSGVSGGLTLRVHRHPDRFRLDARYIRVPCSDGSTASVNSVIEGGVARRGRFEGTSAAEYPATGGEIFFYARGRVKEERASGRLFMYVDPADALSEPDVRCATPTKLRWEIERLG